MPGRDALALIARRHLTPQNLLWRLRVVLEASQGCSNTAIAGHLQINRDTAADERRRYAEAKSDLEEVRSSAPRSSARRSNRCLPTGLEAGRRRPATSPPPRQ